MGVCLSHASILSLEPLNSCCDDLPHRQLKNPFAATVGQPVCGFSASNKCIGFQKRCIQRLYARYRALSVKFRLEIAVKAPFQQALSNFSSSQFLYPPTTGMRQNALTRSIRASNSDTDYHFDLFRTHSEQKMGLKTPRAPLRYMLVFADCAPKWRRARL